MLIEDISISRKENLQIKVFVVGYKHKGESVVLLLMDKGNDAVLLSCVFDCFQFHKHNETIAILRKYGVDKLDFLFWTHPDYDHSYGLQSIVSDFSDDHTQFVLPSNIHLKPIQNIVCNEIDENIMKGIVERNRRTKSSFVSVSPNTFHRDEIASFNLVDYPDEIPVEIHALSPHCTFLNKRIEDGEKINKNELSIFTCISIGKDKFLFCGDTENEALENLHRKSLKNPVFIKIPHHCSSTSDKLLDIVDFSLKKTYSCTTNYIQHKLPNIEILNRYCSMSKKVHYTGSSKEEGFGVVEYTFEPFSCNDLGDDISRMAISCRGSAVECHSDANIF